MHFGEPVDDERLIELLRPGDGIDTVITADVYGVRRRRRAARARARGCRSRLLLAWSAPSATTSSTASATVRAASPGSPTRACAPPTPTTRYLRAAAEASLARVGADSFDLLLLHNPDRTGFSSERVWDAMAGLRDAGLARSIGVAPGPANGFTLDLLDCFERFGDRIDWAMLILNPLEPWPGELALDAAAASDDPGDRPRRRLRRHLLGRRRGRPRVSPNSTTGAFAPTAGSSRVASGSSGCCRSPSATRSPRSSSPAQWDLAHDAVACVAPTLIQERGDGARPIEEKRAELAALPEQRLTDEDVDEIRAIGDNSGSMALKGASPDNDGSERADSWPLSADLVEAGRRWDVDPERDLRHTVVSA